MAVLSQRRSIAIAAAPLQTWRCFPTKHSYHGSCDRACQCCLSREAHFYAQVYYCLAQFCLQWIVHTHSREHVRNKYGLEAAPCSDCCVAFWCDAVPLCHGLPIAMHSGHASCGRPAGRDLAIGFTSGVRGPVEGVACVFTCVGQGYCSLPQCALVLSTELRMTAPWFRLYSCNRGQTG